MESKYFLFGSVACILASTTVAQAAPVTIDFSGHANGSPVGSTYANLGLTFSGAIFAQCGGGCPSPDGSGLFVYGGHGNPFTALFSAPQTLVTFQSVSFSSTLARAFDAMGNLVASVTDEQSFPVTGQVDTLASSSGFSRIVFTYDGGYNGPAITNLSFNAGVPEPATWALMITGFGLVGAAMRKRHAATVAYA